MSHVTGYPARSRDRSCDRHTVTATRSPPHGHRHTATATRPSPHGHRHTATATRPPPRPSHPWPGHVPGHVPSHVPGHVMSHVPGCDGTFDHGNLPGPLAPGHSRRPLTASNLRRPLAHEAPLATIGYQGVVVIRNGRVIKPIERGGGRGGHSGLGGMSWWCGGMS